MASLRGTPSLRLPLAAFPAKKPGASGANVRRNTVILRAPLAARAASASVIREAIRSEKKKYVYPDPIPEFAAAVSEIKVRIIGSVLIFSR